MITGWGITDLASGGNGMREDTTMNEIVNDLLSIVRLHAQILKDATQRAREAERELKDMRASLPHPCDGELYSD